MDSAIITALIVAIGSVLGSAMPAYLGTKKTNAKQIERDTSIKISLENISKNQNSMSQKIDKLTNSQNNLITDVEILKEQNQRTEKRLEKLENRSNK